MSVRITPAMMPSVIAVPCAAIVFVILLINCQEYVPLARWERDILIGRIDELDM